jgi:hypothetical protein
MTPDEREMVRKLLVVYPGPNRDNSADAIMRRKDEFVHEFRQSVHDRKQLSLELLEEAWAERNSTDVEHALIVSFSFGVSPAQLDVLMRLADADWHRSHEDVVSALDELRDKRAVDVLYYAALKRHGYLAFDKARALAVKAIWGLGNTPDDSAMEKLRLLAQSGEEILKDEAIKQLERRATLQMKI